jgi:hypothetical protein
MSLSKESMLEEIKLLSKKDFIWVKQQLQTSPKEIVES